MSVLWLSEREVEALLPMEEAVEVVAGALASDARGETVQPLRTPLWRPDRKGLLGLMPGMLLGWMPGDGEGAGVMGLKVVTVFLDHAPSADGAEAPPSHQGFVMLFGAGDGSPLALMDGASVTAIRTAAASAVATRALAREDASELALLGSGVQAVSHLDAMRSVRPIRRVRVWSRTADNARRFAAAESERTGLAVEAMASAEAAVAGAEVVCTVTASPEPVLEGSWLAPGTHVNAVGACTPKVRELDSEAVRRARLWVDSRESATHEAGDLLIARSEGAIGEDHIIGTVGELLLGRVEGRGSAEEITLFESLGLAVEDLAAGVHVHAEASRRRAAGERVGTVLEL